MPIFSRLAYRSDTCHFALVMSKLNGFVFILKLIDFTGLCSPLMKISYSIFNST